MQERILVLGAGFAGLELAAVLSEELGEEAGGEKHFGVSRRTRWFDR